MAYLLLVEVLLLLLLPVRHHWREALVVHSLPSVASSPVRRGLLLGSVTVTRLFQLPWPLVVLSSLHPQLSCWQMAVEEPRAH